MVSGYSFKKLEIVANLSFFEKIAQGLINFFGYGFGYLLEMFSLSLHGLKYSLHGFRPQSYSYVENGETVWRRIECKEGLKVNFHNLETLVEIFKNSIKKYGPLKCMGYRSIISENVVEAQGNEKAVLKWKLSSYKWLSYNDVEEKIKNCISFYKSIGLSKETKIGLFAETSADWMILALAAFEIGAIVVTVYPTLTNEAIQTAFNQTEPIVVFVDAKSKDRLSTLLPLIPSIKYAICSTRCCDQDSKIFIEERKVSFFNFSLISSSLVEGYSPDGVDVKTNDDAIIMYTSGSSGTPKGVIITHKNVCSILGAVSLYEKYWSDKTYPGYLPLSHILEFITEIATFAHGGKVGYCTPLTLVDNGPMLQAGCPGDLTELKPDVFMTVPLILERIKKTILEKISAESRLTQLVFQTVYNMRADFLFRGYTTPIIDRIFFRRIRNILGGKVQFGMMGGAALSAETEEFISVTLNIFKQAYGLTETCCGATFSNIDYYRPANCGPVIACSEFKLIKWEEGGYSPDDPCGPRGEILIHGDNVSSGYYKNEELTKEVFVVDPVTGKRWFHTGDIGQMLDDGTLRVIDRKKDIIKLSHGEYIPLARIETIMGKSKYIEMVCVTSNHQNSILVAIVVPNRLTVEKLATSLNMTSSFDDNIQNETIINTLKEDILKNATLGGLTKFETPSKICFVTDLWTAENGLVTPSMKIKRFEITKKYQHLLL